MSDTCRECGVTRTEIITAYGPSRCKAAPRWISSTDGDLCFICEALIEEGVIS